MTQGAAPNRFGVVLSGDSPEVWAAAVPEAETCGFWGLGVPDSPSIYPDVYARLASASAMTSHIRLGTWVTNPVTRHPAVTANAIATINQMSGHRAFLGIGSGDSAVRNLGRKPARLAELVDYVETVRGLLRHGVSTWDDQPIRLDIGQRDVPILMAASGPRTLEAAGRVADAVIVAIGLDPGMAEQARCLVAQGARAAGRDPEEVPIWWLVLASIGPSDEEALEEVKSSLATFAHFALRSRFTMEAVPPQHRENMLRLQQRYEPMHHAAFGAGGNYSLADELGVTTFLANHFAVTGSPASVAAKVNRLRAEGMERLWLVLRMKEKLRVLRSWRDDVLPALDA